ncbi:MAG: polysaccharide deacetylase family protein [Kiritimatiellae bacterium]|nr:polysaccharide deacetylase family protein [Kiritimatiellia bacterium]
MKSKFILFSTLVTLLFSGCITQDVNTQGVLLLTFDDRNFAGWEAARPVFTKYGAHATFFVSGNISQSNVASLKRLALDGHCIGFHGFKHQNADKALPDQGAERYYKNEIQVQIDSIQDAGIASKVFAYPNCRWSEEADALFRGNGFKRVRGGVKGATPYDPLGKKQALRKPLVENDAVFFPVADLPNRFRIDTIIVGEAYHTDIDEICACLRRASARKEVICITSHNIAPNAKGIHMKTEWLERILSEANSLGLRVIGFNEL